MIKHGEEDWVGQLFGLLLRRNPITATALLKEYQGKILGTFQYCRCCKICLYSCWWSKLVCWGGPRGIGFGGLIGGLIGTGLVILTGTSDTAVTWKKRFQDKREVESK